MVGTIMAQGSNTCNLATNALGYTSVTDIGMRSTAPESLFKWLRAISLSIKMASASSALKAREVWGTLEVSKEKVKALKKEFLKLMPKIMAQTSKICNLTADLCSELSVSCSTASVLLSKQLKAISSFLKMVSPALETGKVWSIFKTPKGEKTVAPVFRMVGDLAALVSVLSVPRCILGIDFVKLLQNLPLATSLADKLMNKQNPFKTEKGEIVFYPVCKALFALAELIPVCIIGTNCIDRLKQLKIMASIIDAMYNFSKVLGTGDTKEKLVSLLQCANACCMLLMKLSIGVVNVWLTNPAILAVSGLAMYHGIAVFVLSKISAAFFKFDEKYNFVLSAAEEIFSELKLPNKAVDPVLDSLDPSIYK